MNPWHIDALEMTFRLVVSFLLGGLIGFERELNNHAAGLRTNILVCLGSTLIMLLSMYGFEMFADEPNVRMDPARLAAQVITGVGFLGAGTIMQKGLSVKGLTTAATLWVMAAIGLAVGAGFYYPAIICCALVFGSLRILNKLEHRFLAAGKSQVLRIQVVKGSRCLNELQHYLTDKEVRVKNISIDNEEQFGNSMQQVTVTFTASSNKIRIALVNKLNRLPGVKSLKIEG
ncbi:MgtC/SapB family protein [Paenibacillus oenotherae]|uniref:MgtC/SapB family protein n=1 Tax=Paenibacillus oenotherae TaxID=1435645 RepID=A0ABS7D7G1_9BACL|nr:MgtC/SapB family protein [Paenibacillus oenotherae]MBW7475815.1 MgtC/SapB family protein [Paenibacillus oenotherae]